MRTTKNGTTQITDYTEPKGNSGAFVVTMKEGGVIHGFDGKLCSGLNCCGFTLTGKTWDGQNIRVEILPTQRQDGVLGTVTFE